MTIAGLSRHIDYRNGALHVEQAPLPEIAAAHGTPCYVYSGTCVEEAFTRIDRALSFSPHLVAYAMKANSNLSLLKRLAQWGAGVDIVSGGELARALRAGMDPQRIVFSGVGKRADEIHAAIRANIRSIHVESAHELEVIEQQAQQLNARASIGLRVNPDIDPKTHPYISTGMHNSKFGLEVETAQSILPRILASPWLSLEGIACHIGSQLPDPGALREAVELVARLADDCQRAGAPIRSIDAGGGWPVTYGDSEPSYPPTDAYAQAIREGLEAAGVRDRGWELVVEPGRALVAPAGIVLARVLYIKRRGPKRFVIVDAAMTELLRPALYQAKHPVVAVQGGESASGELADVVGPVCETGDFLALAQPLPSVHEGDLVAIGGAGAYAAAMGTTYNARPRPPEVWVEGAAHRLIRRRETVQELWALEDDYA